MAELIVQALWYFIAQVILYFTGKAVISAVSLGRLRTASMLEGTKIKFPKWGGLYTNESGKIVVSPDGQAFVGLVFYVLLVVGIAVYYHLK